MQSLRESQEDRNKGTGFNASHHLDDRIDNGEGLSYRVMEREDDSEYSERDLISPTAKEARKRRKEKFKKGISATRIGALAVLLLLAIVSPFIFHSII